MEVSGPLQRTVIVSILVTKIQVKNEDNRNSCTRFLEFESGSEDFFYCWLMKFFTLKDGTEILPYSDAGIAQSDWEWLKGSDDAQLEFRFVVCVSGDSVRTTRGGIFE